MDHDRNSILRVRDHYTLELYGNVAIEVLRFRYETLGEKFIEPLELMRILSDPNYFTGVKKLINENPNIPEAEMDTVVDFMTGFDNLRVHKIDLYQFLKKIFRHFEEESVNSYGWNLFSTKPKKGHYWFVHDETLRLLEKTKEAIKVWKNNQKLFPEMSFDEWLSSLNVKMLPTPLRLQDIEYI